MEAVGAGPGAGQGGVRGLGRCVLWCVGARLFEAAKGRCASGRDNLAAQVFKCRSRPSRVPTLSADTYSENYADLHRFFELLPDILSTSPSARFSFFHGLGATSRLLYDVYTSVSEMHLREIGLQTAWEEVDVVEGAGEGIVGRWESTGASAADERTRGEGEKKYWREEMVGRYRLPICRLEM